MDKTDDYIKKRLKWKAAKYNLPTQYSFFFEDLSGTLKDYLENQMPKHENNLAVLFFSKSSTNWTLLCTRQIITCEDEKVVNIKIKDISSIFSKHLSDLENKLLPNNKIIKKGEWDQLIITDNQGVTHIVQAHKGPDLFALWNILLLAKKLNN